MLCNSLHPPTPPPVFKNKLQSKTKGQQHPFTLETDSCIYIGFSHHCCYFSTSPILASFHCHLHLVLLSNHVPSLSSPLSDYIVPTSSPSLTFILYKIEKSKFLQIWLSTNLGWLIGRSKVKNYCGVILFNSSVYVCFVLFYSFLKHWKLSS